MDYAQAVQQLNDALAIAPQATRIHYQLGLAYRGLGDRPNAEAHLKRRGEAEPRVDDPLLGEVAGALQNAAAYEIRGAKAIDERKWAEAVANLRKASELAPDNAFTRLNLGTALYQMDDAKGALKEFQEAVRLSPGLAKAHYAIGVLMQASRRDTDAVAAFSTAVQSEPGYVEARLALADALRRTGHDRESLPHYADVIKTNPGVSQASFGYAMALVRLHLYRDARDRLNEGAQTFKDQPGFPHALARLLAAAPDERVRDGAKAIAIMRDLTKTQQTLSMAETMAMALAETGEFDEAVRWQREAIDAASRAGRQDLAQRLSANLHRYEQHQPCRMPWADDDPVFRPGVSP
jgi:tetratricopeptide (TPR) repeat protein